MEAASTGIYVIDKVLHLLKDEAYLFQQANVDIVSLKLELESLSRLIKNTDASEWGVEAWLTEATKAAQRVEFVLDMYLLQFTELRPQRGFNRVALQKGDLNKKLKPGKALASEIQRIVEGLPLLTEWGKERQFFPLEEKSRSTDLSFNYEDENFSTRGYEDENLASAYNDSVGPFSVHGVRIKEGIGYLKNLQTLTFSTSGFSVIKDLKKLRKLQYLSVSRLDSHIVSALSSSIKKMNHLESLSLYASNNLQTFDLKSISSPPPSLGRLILKCRLKKLPKWILMLQNISILGLSSSKLTVDPLKALMSLPNLTTLLLHRAYDGEQLHFEEGSFRKLKQLVLTELHELRMIKIERGALPVLENLTFGPSPLLNEVPSGIQHLRNLKVLASCDMANEFVRSMQPNGGSDHWKVQHIPSVLFLYRVQGRSYVSYTLGEPDLFDHLHGLSTDKNAVSQQDLQWNFCFSDEEEFASTSIIQPGNVNRLSFSSDRCSFFSDDIED